MASAPLALIKNHDLLYFWLPVLLSLILCICIRRRYFSSISDIPGPFFASFSIVWQIYQLIKGHTEVEMINLHRKHGHFVRISHNEVSVAHPDAIKQVLLKALPKSSWYTIFSLPDYEHSNLMSETDPKRSIHKMKNVNAGYAMSCLIKSEPYVDAMIELFERRLDDLSAAKAEVELNNWFHYLAFDVVGEVTFSQAFGFLQEGKDIRNAIATNNALRWYISVMGHFVWLHNATLGNPFFSRLGVQPSSHIFDVCLAAIDSRKKNPEVRKDMMAEWLDTRRKYPDRMEEVEIFGAAVANIGAGADTTAATLQAFFYYMLRHPRHYQRLRCEIDSAHAKGQLSKIVSYAETQNLPFFQACIKETYRFHSAVGLGLPRVVTEGGLTIGGRFFEEGTILSVNPWVFHRNPELFGSDCETFNPERWLDEGRCRTMDYYLIHWGAGYGQCPGRHLAQLEISKVAATVVRDYDIEQVDPKQEWKYENVFTVLPHTWPCHVKRRDLIDLIYS